MAELVGFFSNDLQITSNTVADPSGISMESDLMETCVAGRYNGCLIQ
jgi:hypothetical protein